MWVAAAGRRGALLVACETPGEVHWLEAGGGRLEVNIMSQFSSQDYCPALYTLLVIY